MTKPLLYKLFHLYNSDILFEKLYVRYLNKQRQHIGSHNYDTRIKDLCSVIPFKRYKLFGTTKRLNI